MVITRKAIVDYWLSEPERSHQDGWITMGGACLAFPDIASLSEEEKELLRPILKKHPEYLLHEVFCFSKTIN